MYCKHCGKEIADDSRFCQHCGRNLDALIDDSKEKETASRDMDSQGVFIKIPTLKSKVPQKIMWLSCAYIIWGLFNLYWLFAGEKSGYAVQYFQPFANISSEYSYYDITEFIVYVVGIPLAIWGVMLLLKRYRDNKAAILKFFKSYWIVISIILFAVIFLMAIALTEESADKEYEQRINNQRQQSVPIQQDNNVDSKALEQNFDSDMDDLNRQMNDITNQQINNLPSEIDKHFQ